MTATGEACYHCGEPLPPGPVRTARIGGVERPMCCPGCEAVASLIAGSGLDDFYRFRTAPAPTPASPAEVAADEWQAYDRDAVQRPYVRQLPGDRREAVLLVEGLTCAACAWLIERVLGAEPGVADIQVNPATGRALLQWDPARAPLSALLRRMAGLGYRPHLLAASESLPAITRERRAALKRLIVAGLGMMQVMMYAVALYAGAIHEDMDPGIAGFLRGISLLVATPVFFYAGMPFLRGAWRDLRARRPGMDVPVSLAIGGAYTASVWHIFAGGEIYFDSVTMFVFFLSVARFLEMAARHRASRATGALARMLPATALRVTAAGATERVALAELAVGDRVRVPVGDPVPSDGRIVAGDSRLDESLLTGEFMPVPKRVGRPVVGGSVNLTAPIDIEITRVGQDTLVAGIVRLLDRAQSQRPRLAVVADRVARWFVACVLLAATATGLYWWQTDPAHAFPIVLAVLVVTCPCALSLATPTALVAATARLARQGLLVARAGALETLAKADHLLLDKTGTLTLGRLTLNETVTHTGDAAEARRLAAALQAHSEHPIAQAFRAHRDGREARAVRVHPGRGIEGVVAGRRLRLGRPDWVGAAETADNEGTEVALAGDAGPIAPFRLADAVRPEARAAVRELQRLGFTLEIASGDGPGPVAALARELGIDAWHARMAPEDKLARMRDLQATGRHVVMVGDGVNDAPVLAGADVSVAMGSGSVLAQSSADMVLTAGRLGDLVAGVTTARRTLRVIRQNLAWAASYNTVALPLAAAGLVAPWMAALGMSASSLLVVANAARLGRERAVSAPGDADTACDIPALGASR